ncbi:MAG: AAA family ATPase [Actinobacteria bacterium]|nr:AAA family ATPase [Actinomycetota bacterium]
MNGSDTVVLAISLQKGGVGKTTTAINLGAALAELGFRTLIIDLDPQGNASSGLGIHPPDDAPTIADVLRREETLDSIVEPTAEKNLFVAPAPTGQMLAEVEAQLVAEMFPQPRLKDAIDAVRDDWDYILMDCPPTLGRLTVNAFMAADAILAPVQCQYFALEGLRDLSEVVKQVRAALNPDLEISHYLLTMSEGTKKLSQEVESELRNAFGEKVFKAVIPYNVKLAEAPSMQHSVLKHASTSKGAKAYRAVAKELSNGRKAKTR